MFGAVLGEGEGVTTSRDTNIDHQMMSVILLVNNQSGSQADL